MTAARGVLAEALPHPFGCHLQALWQRRPCRQRCATCWAASAAPCPPVVSESSIFGGGEWGPPWGHPRGDLLQEGSDFLAWSMGYVRCPHGQRGAGLTTSTTGALLRPLSSPGVSFGWVRPWECHGHPLGAVLLGEMPHHQPVSPVPLCQIQSVRLVCACLFAWRAGKNNKRRSAVCGQRGGGLRHPGWAPQLHQSRPELP